MYGFIQFSEDYFPVIRDICLGLKMIDPKIEFNGIAVRRRTVCNKIDKVADDINLKSYKLVNDIEKNIFKTGYSEKKLEYYSKKIGSSKIRLILDGDRDLSPGYVSGGLICRSIFSCCANKSDETRWKYIIGLIEYFYTEFSRQKPDFIFLNEITFAWEIAIFIVAEHLDIPCLSFALMRGSKGYCITDDIYGMVPLRDKLYHKLLASGSGYENYINEAGKILRNFRNKPIAQDGMENTLNEFKQQTTLQGMGKRFIKDFAILVAVKFGLCGTRGILRQANPYDWIKLGIRIYLTGRKTIKNKNNFFEKANPYLNSNYIFYPLHTEPESSTYVASNTITNQLALIEQLSKNMPLGYRLLVKEHVPGIGIRPKNFYNKIKNFPDVHLISPFDDTFKIIRNANLVVTLTGSVGWEAIMLGVPLMIYGYAEYTGINAGFLKTKKLIDFDEEIIAAMKVEKASDEQVISFIAAQLKIQTDFTTSDFNEKFYGVKHDEDRAHKYCAQIADQILEFVQLYRDK